MTYINTLNYNVTQWFEERDLIDNAQPIAQFSKLVEEFGEACDEMQIDGSTDKARVEIGDCMVVINGLANQLGINPDTVIFDMVVTGAPRFDFDNVMSMVNRNCRQGLVTLGRLAECINKGRDATNALREVYFVVQHFASILNVAPSECYALAYAKIKDRKGVMRDGIYVKSEDV